MSVPIRMSFNMRVLALSLVFSTMTAGMAQGSATNSDTQCDMGADQLAQCVNRTSEKEIERLEALYKLVVKMFEAGPSDPSMVSFYDEPMEIIAAQQAWLEYRDKQCEAETMMIGPLSASGVVAATGSCLSRMTRERSTYLQNISEEIGHYSKLCKVNADACRLR